MTKSANLVRRSQREHKRGIRNVLLDAHKAPLVRAAMLARVARTIRNERTFSYARAR